MCTALEDLESDAVALADSFPTATAQPSASPDRPKLPALRRFTSRFTKPPGPGWGPAVATVLGGTSGLTRLVSQAPACTLLLLLLLLLQPAHLSSCLPPSFLQYLEGPPVYRRERWELEQWELADRYDSDALEDIDVDNDWQDYCTSPPNLPASLSQLSSLRDVRLIQCRLEQLPPFVAGLPNLSSLDLRGTNVYWHLLTDEQGRPGACCASLHSLNLSGCRLYHVPAGLAHLCALTCLVRKAN